MVKGQVGDRFSFNILTVSMAINVKITLNFYKFDPHLAVSHSSWHSSQILTWSCHTYIHIHFTKQTYCSLCMCKIFRCLFEGYSLTITVRHT